jgi:hypothetical protein
MAGECGKTWDIGALWPYLDHARFIRLGMAAIYKGKWGKKLCTFDAYFEAHI